MPELNGPIEQKDSQGRVIERGVYRRGRRVGRFELLDFDNQRVTLVSYSEDGKEKILYSSLYAMVFDRDGNYIGRGDLLQSSHINPDGVMLLYTYEYVNGCRRPRVKNRVLLKNAIPDIPRINPGR